MRACTLSAPCTPVHNLPLHRLVCQAASWRVAGPQSRVGHHVTQLNIGNFGDELLDYITAGPKLRKWYGEGERLPRDGGDQGPEQQEEEEDVGPRDAVVVTDGDSEMGEQVVLQLILARANVIALVKDAVAAKTAFGPYVKPIQGDVSNAKALAKGLKSAKAVICTGKLGEVLLLAKAKRVPHVVLLSKTEVAQPSGFSLSGLFDAELAVLRDPAREQAVQAAGIPYTIVRTGKIQDVPGGLSRLKLSLQSSVSGSISREDLAKVLVGSLQSPPEQALVFTAIGEGPGAPPADWSAALASLQN